MIVYNNFLIEKIGTQCIIKAKKFQNLRFENFEGAKLFLSMFE